MVDLLSLALSAALLAFGASVDGASASTQTTEQTPAATVVEPPPAENEARAQIIDLG